MGGIRGFLLPAFLLLASVGLAAEPVPCVVTVDPGRALGPVKIMNAVNNGPIRARKVSQCNGNLPAYAALEIPYARTHDAAFCGSYGGEHTVDVHAIFPDFAKDADDPKSYDFTETDRYLANIYAAGTKPFFRLGSKIENYCVKNYGCKVPPDYAKWAVVCEHIIAHYVEGWADGFKYDLQYWEIWNEPNLNKDDDVKKYGWAGTADEFFAFYRVAALHLKKRFPNLKIGGPAITGVDYQNWTRRFLTRMAESPRVPLDFYSWHIYTNEPEKMVKRGNDVRALLDEFGYTNTVTILNEWNYLRSWTTHFQYSLRQIAGVKGAAFAAAAMCRCQTADCVDMLMYYDARPCGFNGLFGRTTYEPLPTYWTFLAWRNLRRLGTSVAVNTAGRSDLYATAAKGVDGRLALLLVRYNEDDNVSEPLLTTVRFAGKAQKTPLVRMLDEDYAFGEYPVTLREGELDLVLKPQSVVLIEF